MAAPRTPYDAVLHAARDVTKVDTALAAELLGAALLGSVYAVATPSRSAAVRAFVGEFLAATARRRTPAARAIRHVFATLVPDATGAGAVRPGTQAPPWARHVGQVRPVGSWAYGDVYGDQTSYLATFAYHDPVLGGAEHAVVVLVDHNIGCVKDLFVGQPAQAFLAEIRKAAETDELVWLSEVDPGALRGHIARHLEITDQLGQLPEDGGLATDRALVGARLALLPDTSPPPWPAPADPAELIARFLESPYAAGLERDSDPASVQYAIRLIVDFGHEAPDADPLRWSPAVVGLFLLDWVHRRAVLDDDDVVTLPGALLAWTAWAATQRALPTAAVAAIHDTIHTMTPELVRLHGTGERRPPAVDAAAQMLGDGVDPADGEAAGRWLAGQNGGGASPGHGIPRPR